MDAVITWLIRWVHVVGGVLWVGTYAYLGMVLLPRLARGESSATLQGIANATGRFLTVSGVITVVFGLLLVWRSRGFDAIRGEWGALLITSIVLALVLFPLNDVGLKLLRRADLMTPAEARRAGRVALAGAVLGILILGLMTRMLYASGGSPA